MDPKPTSPLDTTPLHVLTADEQKHMLSQENYNAAMKWFEHRGITQYALQGNDNPTTKHPTDAPFPQGSSKQSD